MYHLIRALFKCLEEGFELREKVGFSAGRNTVESTDHLCVSE